MAHREELLKIVQNQSNEELHQFLIRLKKDNTNVKDILEECSRQQTDELWEGIQLMCSTTLMSIETLHIDEESDEIQKLGELIKLLDHTIALINIALHEGPDNLSIAMIDTALLLHGIMPSLPDTAHSTKNSLAALCEYWWNKDIKGKEEIIPNAFDFILSETLQPNVAVSYIKRLWKLHDYLLIVDITQESSSVLRGKLLQCFTCSDFYKVPQGVMFLSFVFSLDDRFVLTVHTALKQEMPFAAKSLLVKFGEVYYRAWHQAADSTRQIIEEKCIQNLMHQAAVAPRTGDPNMASVLHKVLKYLHHQQKDQAALDKMLHDLYTPFLWRYLRAPHSEVRANCASILVEVFPLTTDENTNADLLQKQYEFLVGLLKDPNHDVRLIAVKGVCNILKSYWELLPLSALNGLLSVLVKDLACDSSSDSIRQAVIQGMTGLVDNKLTYTVLGTVLPQIRFSLHDSSEKVRIAVMDLLLKIKRVRTFKYWKIVPINHILSHLTITESTTVKRRIMELTFHNFFPIDQEEEQQVDRLVSLLEKNSDAARHYVKAIPQYLTTEQIAKYMVMICRTVLTLIKQSQAADESENNSDNSQDEDTDKIQSKEKKKKTDDKEAEDEDSLSITDLPIMHGFLECILILWVVTTELFDEANIEILKDLQKKFRVAIPLMLKTFQDPQSIDLIIQIAGYLPAHYVPVVSLKSISKLKQMTSSNAGREYEMFLEAACKWKKVDDVFEIISDWLTAELKGHKSGMEQSNTDQESSLLVKRSKTKGEKRVGFVEPELPDPEPSLGLKYLEYLTSNHICQMILLNKYRTSLQNLTRTLQLYQECGRKVVNADPEAETRNTELILQAFTSYLKCLMLLHDSENPEFNVAKNMASILQWAEQNLIQNFRPTETANLSGTQMMDTNMNNTTKLNTTKRKRALRDLSTFYLQPDASPDLIMSKESEKTSVNTTSSNTTTCNNPELALDMTRILLRTSADVILCGYADVELCKRVLDICLECLDTDEDLKLLTPILVCLYQITEFYWAKDVQDRDSTAFNTACIPPCLAKLYKTIAFYAKRRPEKCGDVIHEIKKYMIQIFSTIIKTVTKDESISRDLMSISVTAVIAELSESSQQFSLGEVRTDLKTLPTLTGWMIEIIQTKTLTRQLFLEEIVCCINSEAVTDFHPLHGLIHLLATLYKYKFKSPKLEDYHKAVELQINNLLDNLSPDDINSEVVGLIKSKMDDITKRTEVEATQA